MKAISIVTPMMRWRIFVGVEFMVDCREDDSVGEPAEMIGKAGARPAGRRDQRPRRGAGRHHLAAAAEQHEAVEERQKGERNEGHALVGVLVEEAAEGRRRQAAEGDEGERDAERLCKN